MSSPASPVAIPFSRRPSAAGGGQSTAATAGRPSYITSFQATMNNAHHSGGSTTQLSMSASSAGSMASSASSSSSSANSPTTPNETTIPPQPPTAGKARTSTAAKRASAKAAAAAKKASASTSTATTSTGAGSTSRGASSSAGSATPTPGTEDKKDWVVPQRAKPGRKPSQEEPLTKRQAQNRASQRAFRERKQNHVATLEKKVEDYEKERLARDAKEAEAQAELRSRNEELEEENAALRQQVKELEVALHQWQLSAQANAQAAEAARAHQQAAGAAPARNGCLQAGCRAPAHEASGSSMSPPQDYSSTRRKRPLPSRSTSSTNNNSNNNRGEGPSSTPDNMGASTSRFGAMSITTAGNSASTAQAAYDYGGSSFLTTPLYERSQEASMSITASRTNNAAREDSPDLMPASDIDMVDRDCGFCTQDTPCLCRGDVADLRGMDEDADVSGGSSTAPVSWMDGVDEMVKIEEQDESGMEEQEGSKTETDTGIAFSVPRRPAMAVASLLTSRRSASGSNKPKLWATTTSAAADSSSASTSAAGVAAAATGLLQASSAATTSTSPAKALPSARTTATAAPARGGSSKLWWTQPLSSTGTLSQTNSALYTWTPTALPPGYRATYGGRDDDEDDEEEMADEAMCSGDPSNCPACNTDPVLAAFCERVAGADENEEEERNGLSEAESSGTASSSATATQRYPYGRPSGSRNEIGYQSTTAAMPPSSDFSFSMQQQQQHRGSIAGMTIATPGRPILPPRSLTTGSSSSSTALPAPTPSFYRRPRGSLSGPSGSTSSSASTSRLPPPPPLSTSPQQHHGGAGSATSPSQGFSIPSAFRQLRAHPGFPKWQGGLDLLADVVSGRGPAAGPNTSAVRGSSGGPSGSPSAPSSSQQQQQQSQQHHKRRRLYLENDRVEEALRLLDGGVAGGSGRAVAETVPCGECPCPCPWARPNGEGAYEEGGEEEE